MTEYTIETKHLTKAFRKVSAVDRLELKIPSGSVYGLLGRNGAGKTTTIRLLMGLLNPTSGEALVYGKPMNSSTAHERQRVAYVSQEQRLYRGLSGEEHAAMIAPLYAKWDSDYAREMARHFDIDFTRPAGALSGGQRRMLAVVLALAIRPDVLLLDEPAAGLDPLARRRLIEALAEMLSNGDGQTVLLSTHLVDDLERIATEVGFMDAGKLVLSRNTDELRERMRRVQIVAKEGLLPNDIAVPGALRSKREGIVLTALASLPSPNALAELEQRPEITVQSFPMNLEETFIALFDDGKETRHDD